MSIRTLNGLSSQNVININNLTGGDGISIIDSNINVDISKQTAKTTISDTDIFILEDSSGSILKITGSNMKSQLEQSSVVSPLLLSGNAISIKGLSGFTANKFLKVNSQGNAIEYVDDNDTQYTAGTNLLLSGNEFSLNSTISNNILFTGTPTINNFIELKGQSGQVGYINFYDTGTTNHISLLSPTNVSGSLNVNLPSSAGTIALQDEIFFNRSTNEVSMKNNSYNLLLGTTSNSNSRKLLVVGDSEIQGDLYLQLNKKLISSNDSNDYLQFGDGTFTNNYSSNIFSKGISFLAGDLQLPSSSGISLGSSATDKITFNSGNFTFGNTGIFNNSVQVKSTTASNSGSVSFFESNDNGTNKIDLHCPEITTHDYNAFLPKITDTSITEVFILSNKNIIPGTNISISNSTTETITINSSDTNTQYTGGTNITLSGTTFNLDTTLVGNLTWTGSQTYQNTLEITGPANSLGYISLYSNDNNKISLKTNVNIGSSYDVILPSATGTLLTQNSVVAGTNLSKVDNSGIVTINLDTTLVGNLTYNGTQTYGNSTTFNADLTLSGGTGLDFFDADNILKITLEGQGNLTQNYVLTLPKTTGEIATLADISSGENFGTNSTSSVEIGNTSNTLDLKGSSQIAYNATLHNFETGLIKTQTKGIFVGNDNTNALNTEIGINHSAATANGISFLTCFLSENQIGDIRQQTNNSVSFNTSSDYRLKTNIENIDCLELINKLQVKKFNFKSDLDIDIVGFIAHEVKETDTLFNSIVSGDKDEICNWDSDNKCWTDNTNCECKPKYQSLDYGKLSPYNTRAIQELYSIIQQQQVVINNLLSSTSFKDFKSK